MTATRRPQLAPERTMEDSKELYLDLIKRCLMNQIYWDHEANRAKLPLLRPDRSARLQGRDWPPFAHTMIGRKRLDNLQFCIEEVLKHDVPGDILEAGVWRGGASILARAVLKACGDERRLVWLADSFEGLPAPDAVKYPQDAGIRLHKHKELAVGLEQVKANFESYGLLDGQVRFLKGWFRDTLPAAPVERLAIARLDGDMYESTMESLTHLYPKLSVGGYLIADDYLALDVCRQAVDDYRRAHGILEPVVQIDWTGVYWKRAR